MKIGVFGTGTVGETIGSKLIALGHEVMMGSRTRDNAKAKSFVDRHDGKASAGTYEDTAKFANVLFNCTAGRYWQEVLEAAGELNLAGKILIDLSNPLDTSKGMPPTLAVCNTDSVAEQIQNRFPTLKVVKALNTMWCGLMVNPKLIAGGDHNTFLSGNDAVAKNEVRKILMSFGWQDDNIIDLGDIATARGPEMYLPLWLRIYGAGKSGTFNIKIVR